MDCQGQISTGKTDKDPSRFLKKGAAPPLSEGLLYRLRNLEESLRKAGKVAVAFSGGVDSSFLLKTAHLLLGEKASGIIGLSRLHPGAERERALRVAGEIGCRIITCELDPLSWPEFSRNPPDRCYLCKGKIYSTFLERLNAGGTQVLLDGTNLDDLQDYRPGLKAVRELGIGTPLADAGLGKQDIRRLSRELGLSTWNQYSSSCLATRIPTHEPITAAKLELVGTAESFLHDLGFAGCRVRWRNQGVSLEFIEADLPRFVEKSMRNKVEAYFFNLGLDKIFLDCTSRPDIRF
jgi:uncharacterized protein